MDMLNNHITEFKRWELYANSDSSVVDNGGIIDNVRVERSVRAQQLKINAITYRPPNTPPHVVPARIVALLLTALEAIAIHVENYVTDRDVLDRDRRILDQKALIRGYLRQLKPFIFEESTPPAPQSPSTA